MRSWASPAAGEAGGQKWPVGSGAVGAEPSGLLCSPSGSEGPGGFRCREFLPGRGEGENKIYLSNHKVCLDETVFPPYAHTRVLTCC